MKAKIDVSSVKASADKLRDVKNWIAVFQEECDIPVDVIEKLSDRDERVLVLDDTPNKKRGKHIELLSWHYDHSTHSYYRGYAQLHLGWSDGHSYMPIDFCIKVSSEKRTTSRLLSSRGATLRQQMKAFAEGRSTSAIRVRPISLPAPLVSMASPHSLDCDSTAFDARIDMHHDLAIHQGYFP